MEENRNDFGGTIRKWWKKRSDDQLIKAEYQQERSIEILQKRFGYTKEKAESELNSHYSKVRFS